MPAESVPASGTESNLPRVPIVGGSSVAPVFAIRTHQDLEEVAASRHKPLPVPLGRFLVDSGVVSADELKEALAMQRSNTDRHIGWIVKTLGHFDEVDLARVLAAHRGIPCVTLAYFRAVTDFRARLPEVATRERGVVVLHEDGEQAWLAIADATNHRITKAVGTILGKPVLPVMAPHKEILDFFVSDWRNGVGTSPGASDSADLRRQFMLEQGKPADSPIR